MTATKIKGIGILVIVAMLLVGYFLVLAPRMSKAGEIREQRDSVAATNETLRGQIKALKKQAEELPAQRALAAEIGSKFPATAEQPELFAAIRDAGIRAGIPERNVTAFAPSAPQAAVAAGAATVPGQGVAAGALATQDVTLTARGNFTQIVALMKNLETLDRAFLVNNVQVSPGGEGSEAEFTLSVTGMMFVLAPPVDPKDAKEPVTAPVDAAAPATEDAPAAEDAPAEEAVDPTVEDAEAEAPTG